MDNKDLDFQWIKMLDVPAIVLNQKRKVSWYNHATQTYFNYDGKDCPATGLNEKKKRGGHFHDNDNDECVICNIIDDFTENDGFTKRTYNYKSKIWEITARPLSDNRVLLYGIELTNQKITELILDKYLQGIYERDKLQDKLPEEKLKKTDFSNIFRIIVENISLPVIVFHNREIAFINESYVCFISENFQNVTEKLRKKIKDFEPEQKDQSPQKLLFQFNDNGSKAKMECVIIPYEKSTYAFVFVDFHKKPVAYSKVEESGSDNIKFKAEVLYVEDRPVNQKIFSIMLENKGCKVDLANNGQEAIDMAKKKKYDIIFMDLQMPVMDGFTAAKIISSKHKDPPPIIAVTAYYDIIEESKLKENGINDIISKPYSEEEITMKLASYVREAL